VQNVVQGPCAAVKGELHAPAILHSYPSMPVVGSGAAVAAVGAHVLSSTATS
jgi:hypothetical protein